MGAPEEQVMGLEQVPGKMGTLEEQGTGLKQVSKDFVAELDALGATHLLQHEQESESENGRRKNVEYKQKMSEQEDEVEEFRMRVQSLEGELQKKVKALSAAEMALGAEKRLHEQEKDERGRIITSNGNGAIHLSRSLSRSNSFVGPMSPRSNNREAPEIVELREKAKFLEAALKAKSMEKESMKRVFHERETDLLDKIECLELANEQLLEGGADSGLEQLQMELTRLQKQNTLLAQRERELQFQLSTKDMLQKEVQHLQELNEQLLDNRLQTDTEVPGGQLAEKIVSLETELAEALEVNNMYKMQLHTAFADQQYVLAAALRNFGDVEQVITELQQLRQLTKTQETELQDMRDRFFVMSIRLAESEAQREELMMKLKRFHNSARP